MAAASLSNEEIEDRYFLLGRMEILNILNDLIHRREPVTVYFNGGRDFILTLLLEARAEALIFDLGGEEKRNLALERSANCVFIATPDGIRVQFSGADPQRFDWGETEAFWVPLPDRVVRMQRRETFRVIVPVVKALTAKLYDETSTPIGDWAVHDLSVGGVGMTINNAPKVKVGDRISHLVIPFSATKRVKCEGIIRHITQIDRQGGGRFRVGVEYLNLPHAMEVEVQRYIIKIEYERRKLLGH